MVNYGSPALDTTAYGPVTDAELFASCEALSNAAVELVDAGASVERVVACMDNVSLALTAVQNGGVTDQMLKTFNSCGELSALLGQENLTPAGLESFADSQIKKVTDTYEAGLEGKLAEYWNKFIAWLKNLWAKIVNWFKNLFINRAKYVKALAPVKDQKDFDPNSKVTCKGLWTDKNVAKEQDLLGGIVKGLAQFETDRKDPQAYREYAELVEKDLAKGKASKLDKLMELDAKERKVSDMFKDLNQFKGTVADYIKDTKSNNTFTKVTKDIDKAFSKLIQDAGKAGNLEGEAAKDAKEVVNSKRTLLTACLAGVRNYNKMWMALGAELYEIYKASNRPPKNKK